MYVTPLFVDTVCLLADPDRCFTFLDLPTKGWNNIGNLLVLLSFGFSMFRPTVRPACVCFSVGGPRGAHVFKDGIPSCLNNLSSSVLHNLAEQMGNPIAQDLADVYNVTALGTQLIVFCTNRYWLHRKISEASFYAL